MTVGAVVFDCWWPHRLGRVESVTATRTRVRWFDGDLWSYDRAHMKFLRKR